MSPNKFSLAVDGKNHTLFYSAPTHPPSRCVLIHGSDMARDVTDFDRFCKRQAGSSWHHDVNYQMAEFSVIFIKRRDKKFAEIFQ
jgi:hypothetical protein